MTPQLTAYIIGIITGVIFTWPVVSLICRWQYLAKRKREFAEEHKISMDMRTSKPAQGGAARLISDYEQWAKEVEPLMRSYRASGKSSWVEYLASLNKGEKK